MIQPGQDHLRRQQLDPRRRQLDGQRQAVQPAGDLRDRRRVLVVERESRNHAGGPLNEQAHRLAGGQRCSRRASVHAGNRERRNRAFLLTGNTQRRAAADQDPHGTGLPQQPRHDRGAGQQVLEVVKDDQQLPLTQLADQVLDQGSVPGILQPDALDDRRRHQARIPDRRQRDEVDAVRVVTGHLRGHGDAQPGLAAAARPGQRDQVAALQQPFRLRQLVFSADEAGQRLGQADPPGARPRRTARQRSDRTARHLRHAISALASRLNATRPAARPLMIRHADHETNRAAPPTNDSRSPISPRHPGPSLAGRSLSPWTRSGRHRC